MIVRLVEWRRLMVRLGKFVFIGLLIKQREMGGIVDQRHAIVPLQ